jgi:hypothetical protein
MYEFLVSPMCDIRLIYLTLFDLIPLIIFGIIYSFKLLTVSYLLVNVVIK